MKIGIIGLGVVGEACKKGFEKKYGSCDIDIKTGAIKYNEDGDNKTDKKDNDR